MAPGMRVNPALEFPHIASEGGSMKKSAALPFFGRKRGRKKEDAREELWTTYMANKNDHNLNNLLNAYDREINMRIAAFSGAMVPRSAMRNFARKKAIRAFESFKPTEASLSTWVSYNVKNIGEDINKFQSEVGIRGKRNRYIGQLKDAMDFLHEDLGREPTIEELSAETGLDVKTTERAIAELNPYSTGFTVGTRMEPLSSDQQQMIHMVRYDLRPKEKLIWDYKWGINGKRKLEKQSDIAKAVGVSDGTVTRTLQKVHKMLLETGVF